MVQEIAYAPLEGKVMVVQQLPVKTDGGARGFIFTGGLPVLAIGHHQTRAPIRMRKEQRIVERRGEIVTPGYGRCHRVVVIEVGIAKTRADGMLPVIVGEIERWRQGGGKHELVHADGIAQLEGPIALIDLHAGNGHVYV